ncbi:MAG TPA: DNA-binding protein [Thiolinea sp.]|nr:DNA-binding protein [Thiolinea sp.]
MPSLLVRNLEPEIVEALKQRAARNGRSAEMEHRIILREVLLTLRKRSFTEALLEIPDVGKDEDFERVQNQQKADDVFA